VRIDDPGLASRPVKLYRAETKGVSWWPAHRLL